MEYQPIYCRNCHKEMAIWDCVDFTDDVCARKGDHACGPEDHACCFDKPLDKPYVFHNDLQLKLYDPFHHMASDGQPIRVASPSYWHTVMDTVEFSMTAYYNPVAGNIVRIYETEYTLPSHAFPFTVRYLAEYDGVKWFPMMTIQRKGHETFGYDYDWRDVDPVNPPPMV